MENVLEECTYEGSQTVGINVQREGALDSTRPRTFGSPWPSTYSRRPLGVGPMGLVQLVVTSYLATVLVRWLVFVYSMYALIFLQLERPPLVGVGSDITKHAWLSQLLAYLGYLVV